MISRLLGLEDGAFAPGVRWRLSVDHPGVFIPAAFFMAFGIYFLYRRERGDLPAGMRKMLAGLRFLVGLVALALLFRPVLVAERVYGEEGVVLVLVDGSLSMTVTGREYADPSMQRQVLRLVAGEEADRWDPRRRSDRLEEITRFDLARSVLTGPGSDLLERLKRSGRVEAHLFSSQLGPVLGGTDGVASQAQGSSTRLGDVLRQLLARYRGQAVNAVVLLSDGRSTAGEDPLAAARLAGDAHPPVPIYPIPVGTDAPSRDLVVRSLHGADWVVLGGDPWVLRAVVAVDGGGEGVEPTEARIRLLREEELVEERTVTLPPAVSGEEIVFRELPKEVGPATYTVEAVPLPGEWLVRNNRMRKRIRVVDQKMKVLYVEGYPRWQYRKLVALLERNREVFDGSCLLLSADADWPQPGSLPVRGLECLDDPRQFRERYDLVLLGDVDPLHPELQSGNRLSNLAEFVREGGGLVLLAGPRHMPQGYRSTVLEDLFPFRMAGGMAGEDAWSLRQPLPPFRFLPTDRGMVSPWMALGESPEESRRLWGGFPAMHRFFRVEGVKPLAVVLAEHPSERTLRGDPVPLLVRGGPRDRCLFLGVEESWRWGWGYPEENGGHPFNRFWGGVLRTLAMEKMMEGADQISLTVQNERIGVGDSVSVRVRIGEGAARKDPFLLRLRRPDGSEEEVPCLPSQEASGSSVYEGTFLVREAGVHRLGCATPKGERIEEEFDAGAFTAEFDNPRVDRVLLEGVAEASGGRMVSLDRLEELPDWIRARVRTVRQRTGHPLWGSPALFGVFCLLITAEWLLRRRCRLM
jgi:hypothetical protein